MMQNTGIDFNNKVEDGRVENSFLFRNFYNGGGVAIGDINNDGLADLFMTSNMGANKLYLNKGNWKFEDISDSAGIIRDSTWSTGVTFVDINNDGWLDIYVCSSGHMSSGFRKNKLYINDHNLHFTEAAHQYGLDISAYTTQVSFFDYDLDGDLDCFMINNSPIPVNQLGYANMRDLPEKDWAVGNFLKGGGDHLFRNDNGHFTEVTREAGIHGSLISFGLGVSVTDINGDGYPDVFVSNDSYERDYLYINQRNGKFKDELEDWMRHTSMSSMGADVADINNDGHQEIFTTDMFPDDDKRLKLLGGFDNIDLYNGKLKAGFYHQYVKNCLQFNNGNNTFSDIGNYAGVSASDWSWGALIFDADNDGLNDIYVCNGVNKDVTNLDFLDFFANDFLQKMVLNGEKKGIDQILAKIPRTPLLNKAYRNIDGMRFEEFEKQWGMTTPSFSNGAAYGDLDNDGDLDLVVNNENQPAFIYRNNSREVNGNNYIGVNLEGSGQNRFAIGSKIRIYMKDSFMMRELIPSRGFQSSIDYKILFGLGKTNAVDSLVIEWPDRKWTVLPHPAINQVHSIKEENSGAQFRDTAVRAPVTGTLFTALSTTFEKHTEDDVIDFYREYNIPKMLSREGPKAAVADVNGDGLDDLYIGGTPGHPGILYLQNTAGQFLPSEQKAFAPFSEFEDGAVLFFDCDRDGDQDLLVCGAGNTTLPNSRELQLRLYRNDGKGNFTLDASAFSNVGVNVTAAAAGDFNGDGYPDLFIGGRSVPGNYGLNPNSFLFINQGNGHFKDATATAPGLGTIGMVTGASFADLTGDGKPELVVSGEWIAPHIFEFTSAGIKEIGTNLSSLCGWWESLCVADVNGDGRQDLILGNIGENFYLKPDSAHPVKLWVYDFDQNGIMDKIMTQTIEGRDMPVFLKHDIEKQIPAMKKQNLRHESFSEKSVQELFPEAAGHALVKSFSYCSSVVALNEGNGRFTVRKLPTRAQLSSINAIQCLDVNGDGRQDLILGGNEFGFLPQFGRLDASRGDVLINTGQGNFNYMLPGKTGLSVPGMVRDIKLLPGKTGYRILFLQNDDYPVLYFLNKRN